MAIGGGFCSISNDRLQVATEEGDRRTRGNRREEGTVVEWENFHIGTTANRDHRPLPAITQPIKTRHGAGHRSGGLCTGWYFKREGKEN